MAEGDNGHPPVRSHFVRTLHNNNKISGSPGEQQHNRPTGGERKSEPTEMPHEWNKGTGGGVNEATLIGYRR